MHGGGSPSKAVSSLFVGTIVPLVTTSGMPVAYYSKQEEPGMAHQFERSAGGRQRFATHRRRRDLCC
jgi:hypothetical protein